MSSNIINFRPRISLKQNCHTYQNAPSQITMLMLLESLEHENSKNIGYVVENLLEMTSGINLPVCFLQIHLELQYSTKLITIGLVFTLIMPLTRI